MPIEGIIKKDDGKVSVDWKRLVEVDRSGDERGYDCLVDVLRKENVLSFSEENTYAILAGGLDGSPLSSGLIRAYFPKKEDALAYAEAKYGGAMYDIRIVQFIPERIKKRR